MSEWDLPSGVEETSIERVGGGYAWESGVHDATVKLAYLDQAKSEAVSCTIVLTKSDGKELRESFWIKSGKEKGHKTYYTKDGKDYPLPGYSVANSLCVAATGESLAKAISLAEKKTINVYNAEQKKEVPTQRPVLVTLLNKQVKVAVHQVLEDQQKKNAAGAYESTGKTRTTNECKFFGNMEGKTAEEITKGEEASMFQKWAEKNTGQVIDKTDKKKDGADSAASIMGGGQPANTGATSSLFR